MKKKEKDWSAFYKSNQAPDYPSDFCRFVMSLNLKADSVIDVGCGNCRDTRELAKKWLAIGIDKAFVLDSVNKSANKSSMLVFEADFKDCLPIIEKAGIIYSRFFLHSIALFEIGVLLDSAKRYFCAETRIIGDEPKLYQDHDRSLVDGKELIKIAIEKGFEILYYSEGRGMAKYRDEDPLVARIILRRKIWKE